ncbi:hypothetical protein ACFWNJ_31245, partial [Streptomyces sp. NPDC058398]
MSGPAPPTGRYAPGGSVLTRGAPRGSGRGTARRLVRIMTIVRIPAGWPVTEEQARAVQDELR